MDERIDRLQRISAARPGVLGLAGGLPADELFPRVALADAFLGAVSGPRAEALQYGWPEGSEGLRSFLAGRLRARGARVDTDDVVVTSGAQQALALALEILGVGGRRVTVDGETYPGALDLLRSRGAVPSTSLEGAAGAYVVVGASNPRGVGLAEERRRALLGAGVPLVVDEAYAELRFDGRRETPLLADAPERVFHVGTFSKTLCPGLRVGWLVPPRSVLADAVRRKREADLQASSLAQAVLERWVAAGGHDVHLERCRRAYAARMDRLVGAVRAWLAGARFVEPEGGFTLFVETDLEGVDEARALALAAAHGTSFDPGSMFRATESKSPLAMRLSCASVPSGDLDEAVRRLARAIAELRRSCKTARQGAAP